MISISLEITTFLKKGSSFAFPKKDNNHGKSSISLNEGFVITDRETYNAYNWPSPEDFSTDGLKRMADYLPDGMKIIIFSPDGILENVIRLIGYENLCYLLYDEPDVVSDVFEQVGSRIYRYYKTAIDLDCVGGIIYNDDWGFNQQTMISADDMRSLLFPHVDKIVKLAHSCDKPVILHSCGQLNAVYDDIISMGIDGKHSYEDIIEPVESAYDKLHDRIAVIGGMDLDYVCRKTPAEVNDRARAMCKKNRFQSICFRYRKQCSDVCSRRKLSCDDCCRSSLTRYDFQYVMIFSSRSSVAPKSNTHMLQTEIESI